MKNKSEQHTPTPWKIEESYIGARYMVRSAHGDEAAMTRYREDAAFIVRAVNRDAAVDELIAVANRVRAVLNDEGKEILTKREMEDMLFKAIASAEGK